MEPRCVFLSTNDLRKTKLHPTSHQHESEENVTEFSFLDEFILQVSIYIQMIVCNTRGHNKLK